MTRRQLHLNAFLMSTGHHEASWRLPESDPYASLDLDHYRELARIAERGTFDSLFLADGPVLFSHVGQRPAGVLEPLGFELTDQLDIPGGYNGFDATAEDGARLAVRSKLGRPSTIDLVAPVLGDCPASGSETLAP